MRRVGSLRSHLIWGAVFWTLGIITIHNVLYASFLNRHFTALRIEYNATYVALAIVFMLAGYWQVRRGLSPLDQMRERLGAVRNGHASRLEGDYPIEVRPLVNDLNEFLDHREMIVKKAIAKAGDLAHGLKTPLAILSQEAERAEQADHAELAATINQQVLHMRRQVDYHLAHARAAASGATPGTRCSVSISADGLSRTLQRLYDARSLKIQVDCSTNHHVRVQREDLDEMLGNLLDNACKWAKSQVTLHSSEKNGRIAITVDDDGPGIAPSLRDSVLRRGVRADESPAGPGSPSGSGLGLAIVRDLAELYGGSISLDSAPSGGLGVTLDLPAAESVS
ncbi:MAG: HAMP domain-containing sensor histidine kinase [Candidatus Acidiferrales bacterium]